MACQGFNWWEGGRSAAAGARAIARARAARGGAARAPNPKPKPKLKLRRPARRKKKNPATKGDAEGRQCDLTDGATGKYLFFGRRRRSHSETNEAEKRHAI